VGHVAAFACLVRKRDRDDRRKDVGTSNEHGVRIVDVHAHWQDGLKGPCTHGRVAQGRVESARIERRVLHCELDLIDPRLSRLAISICDVTAVNCPRLEKGVLARRNAGHRFARERIRAHHPCVEISGLAIVGSCGWMRQ
jgi:hypothetical protein